MPRPEGHREAPPYESLAALEGRVKNRLELIFNQEQTGEARVQRVSKELGPLFDAMENGEVAQSVRAGMSRGVACADKDSFVTVLSAVLQPLLTEVVQHMARFEMAAREEWRRESNFTPLSEMLSYEKSGDTIRIHLASSRSMGAGEKIHGVREGLQKLAEVVAQDGTIKEISATSWIIAQRPGLLEKLGFTVEPDNITEEERQAHFAEEKLPVRRATITREDFLARYLKK